MRRGERSKDTSFMPEWVFKLGTHFFIYPKPPSEIDELFLWALEVAFFELSLEQHRYPATCTAAMHHYLRRLDQWEPWTKENMQ